MRLLGRADLKALLDTPEDASVSIFLPTQRTGDLGQGAIRLKNLLREAEEKLLVSGLRRPDAERLLEKGKALGEDTLFWHHQADGLAVFIAKDTFTYFRLPYHLDEVVVVANRFYVSPLLPMFAADGIFYVLGLSQNKVILVQCSRDGARDVTPESMPPSMADVLQFDEVSRDLQSHAGPQQGASGRGPAIFHGHGEGKDEAKDNIVRFLREVDRSLRDFLKLEQPPLVLAGVSYLSTLFREVTTYTHLLDEGVEGNPDQLSPAELQSRAWPLVAAYFAREREEALSRFGDGSAHGLTASRLQDVLLAAHDGRVAALFVALGVQGWGVFSAEERRVEVHAAFVPGDEDLMDAAVVRALLTGAAVHVMAPADVPNGEPIAALLRY